MQRLIVTLLVCAGFPGALRGAAARTIARRDLYDRIRGAWAGQMIGNIQGLPFEFKYKDAVLAPLGEKGLHKVGEAER
jgi:hypothetical protein